MHLTEYIIVAACSRKK